MTTTATFIPTTSSKGTSPRIADGTWSHPFVIPVGTPLGSYDVLITCFLTFPSDALTTNVFGFVSVGPATEVLSAASVDQGSTITAHLTGFEAGESVIATLHSTPVQLASFTASPGGNVTATLTIPATTDPGAHEIAFVGQTSGQTAQAPLTVSGGAVAPATTHAAATTAPGTTTPKSAAISATTATTRASSVSTSAANPVEDSSSADASGAVAAASVTDGDSAATPANPTVLKNASGVAKSKQSVSANTWIVLALLVVLAIAGTGGTLIWRRRPRA